MIPERGTQILIWGLGIAGVCLAVSGLAPKIAPIGGGGHIDTVLQCSVRPHTFATLSSGFPGQITSLQVAVGSTVAPGDVLFSLVNPDYELEYERTKVRYVDLQRRLALSQAHIGAPGESPASVRSARVSLTSARDRLANSPIRELEAGYRKAADRAALLEKLVHDQLATDTELEDARQSATLELRNLKAEREHLSRLQEELQLATVRLSSEQNAASANPEGLSLRMDLREAAEAMRIADKRRQGQRVVSTIKGTITKLMVHGGDQIAAGIPMVQISQLDQLDFDVPVGATMAQHIKAGQFVKVHIPTEPPTIIGARVGSVLLTPSQDASAYTIRVTVPNPSQNAVLIGLPGEIELFH